MRGREREKGERERKRGREIKWMIQGQERNYGSFAWNN